MSVILKNCLPATITLRINSREVIIAECEAIRCQWERENFYEPRPQTCEIVGGGYRNKIGKVSVISRDLNLWDMIGGESLEK